MNKSIVYQDTRKRWNNMRISRRMLISYIFALLIPIVLINALTFTLTRNTALDTVSRTIDVTLANGNSIFNSLFTGLYERAVATSNTRELAFLFDETRVATVSGSVPTLKLSETLSALNVIYGTSPQYYYKFYAERQNLSYYSGNLQIVNSSATSQQAWYQQAIRFGEGVYWHDVHADDSFGFPRRFVTACRTIRDEQGEALGLATVSLDFARVEEAFVNLMAPYRGTIYILDREGNLLYSQQIDSKTRGLAAIPGEPIHGEVLQAVMKGASTEEAAAVTAAKGGKTDKTDRTSTDQTAHLSGSGRLGSDAIYNFTTIDQLMWKIVTVLPQEQFLGMTNSFWTFLLPVLLGTIGVFLVVTGKVSKNLSRPIEVLSDSMQNQDSDAFPVGYLQRADEIGELTRAYARMLDRNAQLIEEARIVNEKKRVFQLEALQRQIDSHFIHNTLNNIQWLAAAGRNEDVISTATSLAKLLKACSSQKNELVTIEDELDYVDSYLNIQKIRFGNRFTYRFDLNPLLLQMRMPMFVLQPIVENSIYHGLLDGRSENGFILIRIFQEDGHIVITVYDNGRGVPRNQIPDVIAAGGSGQDRFMGIALKNIDTRLKLVFGDEYGLSISSEEGEWTEVRIRIPVVGEDSHEVLPEGGTEL